jgi:putative CocE/NonD family hydrolase
VLNINEAKRVKDDEGVMNRRNMLKITKASGGTEEARRGQHLIVLIGGHAGYGRKICGIDFGSAAAEYLIPEDDVTLQWYDYLFKGIQNEFVRKPVKIFVMGINQWREEDDWPLARAQDTRYFLHSSGSASSLNGSGSLTTTQAHFELFDHYVYDPANPVPTDEKSGKLEAREA